MNSTTEVAESGHMMIDGDELSISIDKILILELSEGMIQTGLELDKDQEIFLCSTILHVSFFFFFFPHLITGIAGTLYQNVV